ncbi:HAMP domain-containing protein [Nitratireductor sp. CAU 1489]|uniref:histidine kinase n=1 Tax=Nitratireductor arenosus TaxID=2682096 RepID=A0A844QEK2_9HYPH|nr:ATP-binding protein [Nitratireductor arenosus]MVA96411.1 HAMP domain-containing protein [Nitratireductor arenosus]
MRGSLFLKIYLTLLASLAVVAVVGAVVVRIGLDERDTGWRAQRDLFVAAILPADGRPEEIAATLRRLSETFDTDLTLFDRDGLVLARAGAPIDAVVLDRHGRHARREDGHVFVMRLPDGRALAARMDRPFGPSGRNPIAYLALIAGVIGIAAYPVVRQLTRRLERLRRGVDAWGEGALMTRVDDRGRDEVAAVAKSFNRAAAQIERLILAHRSLLANASHELRSPLARLRMAIDLYERSPAETTKQEIVRNLAEVDELVDEILLASRLAHLERLENSQTLDLLALVTEEGARQQVSVGGRPAQITGEPRLITRLVRNLMQNALRHGARPVTASVVQTPEFVRLSVEDHGKGVPESESARVFEPFYRPAGRSETAGGWGLGLSLVRQIANHHGASVRLETPEGGGARFVVDFPHRA